MGPKKSRKNARKIKVLKDSHSEFELDTAADIQRKREERVQREEAGGQERRRQEVSGYSRGSIIHKQWLKKIKKTDRSEIKIGTESKGESNQNCTECLSRKNDENLFNRHR